MTMPALWCWKGVKRHAIGTPDRHAKGTPDGHQDRLVRVVNRRAPRATRSALTSDGAAARGRGLFAHRGKPGWHSGAVLKAPALVSGLNDFAVMGQPVEQRGCHLGVAEHAGPFAEGQVGGDDDGSALVEPADQMEEQLSAGLGEG